MADTSTAFDWRQHARDVGLTTWQAWAACQRALVRYPHGVRITSPQSLDVEAADPAMHDVIRAAIDDAAGGS